MPVEFADKKKRRRVKFLTGVFHEGVDYGPDYEKKEAEIDAASAAAYVAQGRAVYADSDSKSAPDGKGGK